MPVIIAMHVLVPQALQLEDGGPPPSSSMGGKRTWQPKRSAADPRCIEAATGRLTGVREGLAASAEAPTGASSAARGSAAVEPSATAASQPSGSYGAHRSSGVQPRGQPTTPVEELAALRLGRTAPAAFNLVASCDGVRAASGGAIMTHQHVSKCVDTMCWFLSSSKILHHVQASLMSLPP